GKKDIVTPPTTKVIPDSQQADAPPTESTKAASKSSPKRGRKAKSPVVDSSDQAVGKQDVKKVTKENSELKQQLEELVETRMTEAERNLVEYKKNIKARLEGMIALSLYLTEKITS